MSCGIDIGKANLKATVRVQGGPGRKTRREARTFDTTTPALLGLRDWLVDEQVTLVGMESTGVFWKPVYYLLEEVVECWLLNAQHLKKVSGRRTAHDAYAIVLVALRTTGLRELSIDEGLAVLRAPAGCRGRHGVGR